MATTILVALYLRASTDEQTESIPAQLMLLNRYAKDDVIIQVPAVESFDVRLAKTLQALGE